MYLLKLLYSKPSLNQYAEASKLQLNICNQLKKEYPIEFDYFDDTYLIQNTENTIRRVSITSNDLDIDLITNIDLDFFSLAIDVKNEYYIDIAQEVYNSIEGWSIEEIIVNIENSIPHTFEMSIWKIWLINASLNGSTQPNYSIVKLLQEELHSSNPTNRINVMYAVFVNPLYRRYLLPTIQILAQIDIDEDVQKHAKEVISEFTQEEIQEVLTLQPQKLALLSPSSPYKLPPEILEIHTKETIEQKDQIITAHIVSYYSIPEIEDKEIYKVENIRLLVKEINKSKQLYTLENIEPFMVIWNSKAQHYPQKVQLIIDKKSLKNILYFFVFSLFFHYFYI